MRRKIEMLSLTAILATSFFHLKDSCPAHTLTKKIKQTEKLLEDSYKKEVNFKNQTKIAR